VSKQLIYKNIKISYTDEGKGNVVVLLHGFLENKGMWDKYVTALSKTHRVITIDLLGHGETECLGYVHVMEDQADMLYAVMVFLRLRKVTLVGHSMGGYVALAFAELYPDYVKGLFLLNSTARADNEERKINRDRAILCVKHDYTNFVRMSISNLFSEDSRERLAKEIEKTKQEALKTPLQGIIASLEGMKIRKDREVLLHFAPYPIHMALGKKDGVLIYEDTIDQIEGTRVELTTFPDGHMSHIENEKELKAVLINFLKKI